MKEIFEEIIKFIFCIILATILLWTGEIIISGVTLGKHRPRWNGYRNLAPVKRVGAEIGVGIIGFMFWIASIAVIAKFFGSANVA